MSGMTTAAAARTIAQALDKNISPQNYGSWKNGTMTASASAKFDGLVDKYLKLKGYYIAE